MLLNVNRSEAILAHKVFTDQNGVLVVAPFPRKEGYNHILAQSQLAKLGRRAISQDHARVNPLAFDDDRPLVDAGALVGTIVFP